MSLSLLKRLLLLLLLISSSQTGRLYAQNRGITQPPVTINGTTYGGHLVAQPVPHQPTTPLASDAYYLPQENPTGGSPNQPSEAECYIWPSQNEPQLFASPALNISSPQEPSGVTYENQISFTETLPKAAPAHRSGVYQGSKLKAAYLPSLSSGDLEATVLRTEIVFALPFFRRDTPLVITPSYEVQFLSGPNVVDLPSRLHEAAIQLRHLRMLNPNLGMDVAINLILGADDHSFDAADAFRVTGYGMVGYDSSPITKWVLGAAYVNRSNSTVVPIFGVVYKPNADFEAKLVFPNPKIAWRLSHGPIAGQEERWLYITAEFGQGRWAIRRGATQDQIEISDSRLILGLEQKHTPLLIMRYELAYIFDREYEFKSGIPTFKPNDTLMLRFSANY